MREIKFKAWDEKRKKMYDWEFIKRYNWCMDDFDNSQKYMQYTGLKDKNGREIYEGDIVASQFSSAIWHNSVVGFRDGAFGIEFDFPTEGFVLLSRSNLKTLEVIGNIYENPELLKGGGENNGYNEKCDE